MKLVDSCTNWFPITKQNAVTLIHGKIDFFGKWKLQM